jgi:crotonobetainyl-CoA:carnitine CoA-transferase CaiB-like acyl-CoA transferase
MRPLDGIRVIDLTRVLSGPFCTMTLADLGAEVIKIESASGDDTRHWGPPFIKGESTFFLSANRSKKSVLLDLKADMGKQVLWDLIETADIVVENFRPGTLDRLGFSWEEIHRRTPGVILVSISGYGQTGPLAASPGYDLIAQGEGGLMSVTGEPGRPPVKVGFSIADIGTGMWAVIGTLAALRAREQNGLGDRIDVSLLDTVVSWQTYHAEASLMAGEVPKPLGSAHPTIAPYQTFAAIDGYFNLAVGNDALWNRFCEVLDAVGEKDH